MTKLKLLTEQEMFESKKRFNKLVEYSFVNQESDLLLDEDDDVDPNNADPNSPEQGQAMPAPAPTQGNAPTQGQEPNLPNIPNDGPPATGNETPTGDEPQIDTTNDPNVGTEDGEMSPMDDMEPDMGMSDNNEVEIDVTDLTSKQDDISSQVGAMATQNQQMMDILSQLADKVQGIVKNTETEMADLKSELIKRNPTPVETLQKRITVSDPFTQTPADYWDKKQAEGHYRLSDDDDENKEQYEINPQDINNSNVQDVYKSFGLDDDEMNQSLATMFRI